MRERICRQGLKNAAGHELVEPAIEKLHHIRAIAGHVGGDHARLVVGIGKGDLLDGDIRIFRLEVGDELIHRLYACLENILPVFDFHCLCRVERESAESGNEPGQQN
ncbi:hypothetical protein D3C80_1005490 [compost metagenome]